MTTKKITILRHGMPEAHYRYPYKKHLKGSDLNDFVKDWDNCELSSENVATQKILSITGAADKCISSALKRSIESFHFLGVHEFESSTLLNEAAFPHGFPGIIKLPLSTWMILIRILWFSGYAKNAESYIEFKKRIQKAYNYVNAYTSEFDNIAVIGHGLTNMHLKKVMRRNHWNHIEHHGGYDYWSFDRYEKEISG